MSSTTFRANYPEFADVTKYPESQVNFYLTLGGKLLRPIRWGSLLDTGIELFTAHNVALEAVAQRGASAGQVPGLSTGAVASKSIDKVSVSYDTNAGIVTNAGHWNLTIYGTRFLQLMRMAGTGGVQL